MKILITGAAGFIGYHLSKELISLNHSVIGIDNLNAYYDRQLKLDRLNDLANIGQKFIKSWKFLEGDIQNEVFIDDLFSEFIPEIVIHLAAQAGVRYSLINPKAYISSNIVGFCNILEACRKYPLKNFLYASSSSVYGGNRIVPFKEESNVDHPVSLYAATKKSNELIAHTYSHLYKIPSTGLRFFTVYGPWGRPDMAPMIFTKAILENKPIRIFNKGLMSRDFTYIDDIIECIVKLIDKPAKENNSFDFKNPNPAESWCPHQIFNLGNNELIKLMDFIEILESTIGKKAIKKYEPMQPGDVVNTFANTERINNFIGFKPSTNIKYGVKKFINWYNEYYAKTNK